MLEISLRVAVLAAFPSSGFALVPLARLLERMDILERERVADLLVPAMGGEVRTVRYPDILVGSVVSVDVDNVFALRPAPRGGYLQATPEMLRGDEALRLEAVLMAFRAQIRELAAQGQAA